MVGQVMEKDPLVLESMDREFFQGVFTREDSSYTAGQYMKPHKVAGDVGGLTKYGITEKSYPNIDIANLSEEQAIEILKRDNLNHQRYRWGGATGSDAITYKLTDIGFNAGPRITNEIMQLAINDIIDDPKQALKIDAQWVPGGKTDRYYKFIIETGGEKQLMDKIIHHTKRFYKGERFETKTLGKQDVKNFGKGWQVRADWNPLKEK